MVVVSVVGVGGVVVGGGEGYGGAAVGGVGAVREIRRTQGGREGTQGEEEVDVRGEVREVRVVIPGAYRDDLPGEFLFVRSPGAGDVGHQTVYHRPEVPLGDHPGGEGESLGADGHVRGREAGED